MNARKDQPTSGTYEPNLVDVAKLVHATGSGEPKPEVTCLFQWLVDQVPDLRGIWNVAHEARQGGITLRELAELRYSLLHQDATDETCATAIRLLRQVPRENPLWVRLQELGRDAGLFLHVLVAEFPELEELWKTAHEVCPGGITLFDLIDLRSSIVHGRESDEAYATATRLLRLVPQTNRLWEELEQMGRDAGLFPQYPRFAVDVLRYHDDVDRLLASDSWSTAEEFLDCRGTLGASYDEWIRIVEARLARGEGDKERLAEVREKLRFETVLARNRPLLEDHLTKLAETLGSTEGRSRLAETLGVIRTMLEETGATESEEGRPQQ